MASRKLARGRVEQALAEDQQRHAALVRAAGEQRTRALLEDSARDLERRLRVAEGLRAPSGELARHEFTLAQLRATLAQVRSVLKQRTLPGLKGILVDGTAQAADGAAQATVAHLARADAAFRGVGTQPLALDEARLLDRAAMGAHSSLLHRLSSGGTTAPGADSEEHHAKAGILARYGASTIEHFERVLQLGVLQRKSWRDMRDDLRKKSPFLMGKPAWWAQRIVRTELMGAAGRGAWEASRLRRRAAWRRREDHQFGVRRPHGLFSGGVARNRGRGAGSVSTEVSGCNRARAYGTWPRLHRNPESPSAW